MLVGVGAVQTVGEKAALVTFQQSGRGSLPMSPHGHPDANTLINQGVYDPVAHWPSSQTEFLATGEKPGTFLRDLSGASNQVPRWAWFTAGGVCALLGFLAYRRHRKSKKTKKK